MCGDPMSPGGPCVAFFFFFLISISGTQRLRRPFKAFLGTRGTSSHECLPLHMRIFGSFALSGTQRCVNLSKLFWEPGAL